MPPEKEEYYKSHGLFFLFLVLFVVNIFIFYISFQRANRELTFAMLNVEQGDGLFIQSPTGTQILVDVGPPRKILGPLARVMPLFDRRIDAIIITNPDQDHIGGFADVLKTYKVDKVFEPGTSNDSKTYQNIEEEIKNKNITKILAKKGMRLDIGGGAVIDILFPDRDVADWTSNDGSIVGRLIYGETSVLLSGDTTAKIEEIILSANAQTSLDSTILKVGHHGSRTSTSAQFVKAVSPEYALISDGKDNKYGHPHPETLDTLKELGVKVIRTDLVGTIILKSDGINESFSFHR